LHEIWILPSNNKICETIKGKPKTKTKTKTRHWAGYPTRGPLTRQCGLVLRAWPALGLPPAHAAADRASPRVRETEAGGNSGERVLTAGGPSDETEHTVMLTTPNRT
jgi:hypothetical protein